MGTANNVKKRPSRKRAPATAAPAPTLTWVPPKVTEKHFSRSGSFLPFWVFGMAFVTAWIYLIAAGYPDTLAWMFGLIGGGMLLVGWVNDEVANDYSTQYERAWNQWSRTDRALYVSYWFITITLSVSGTFLAILGRDLNLSFNAGLAALVSYMFIRLLTYGALPAKTKVKASVSMSWSHKITGFLVAVVGLWSWVFVDAKGNGWGWIPLLTGIFVYVCGGVAEMFVNGEEHPGAQWASWPLARQLTLICAEILACVLLLQGIMVFQAPGFVATLVGVVMAIVAVIMFFAAWFLFSPRSSA